MDSTQQAGAAAGRLGDWAQARAFQFQRSRWDDGHGDESRRAPEHRRRIPIRAIFHTATPAHP